MGLANEAGHPHEGRVDFIDNRLNPQTGAMRMRASFDNSAGLFTPGLAVRLTMGTSAPYSAVLVPDRAIGTDQTKKFVYVVGADNQPQVREVQAGRAVRRHARRSRGDSVKPGENVIVDGLQRVVPGMPVAPQVLKVDAKGMPICRRRAPGRGSRPRRRQPAQAMNISSYFIDRPRFAGVLSIFIFLVGLLAIFNLPVSEYPEVAPPQIVVRAQFPGANPRVISETVATPLEEQINGVENLLYFDSQATADGSLSLTVTFKIGTDPEVRPRPRCRTASTARCRACPTSCARSA